MSIERETVHISDTAGRIAMKEVRTQGTDPSPASLTRYIYSNHLQSASLELDENAAIISYEEYHPYGTTSYQASNTAINAVAKRYRYTGKERDEESGLYYHGARYYIPWLVRWTAVDPVETKYAGMSPYNYAFDNPIIWNDPSGTDPKLLRTEISHESVYNPENRTEDISENNFSSVVSENAPPVRYHTIQRGETLTSISKKYGVSIEVLAKINKIEDINKIKANTIISVLPEAHFKYNPYGGYRNPIDDFGAEYETNGYLANIGIDFVLGGNGDLGARIVNQIITDKKIIQQLEAWSEVRKLIDKGKYALKNGETVYEDYFKAPNLARFTFETVMDKLGTALVNLVTNENFKSDDYFTPIHVLGSFSFSLRLNGDGKTATAAIYDSKSISSISDNILGSSSNKSGDGPFNTTYQRYIWTVNLK